MVNIIKQEVVIEESLKKKLELICEFSNTTFKIINGGIRKIDRTNLTYVEPHRIIINDKIIIKSKNQLLNENQKLSKQNEDLKHENYQLKYKNEELEQQKNYLLYYIKKFLDKMPKVITDIVEKIFDRNMSVDLYKSQYDSEMLEKQQKRIEANNRRFNLFNKREIEKATKHLNNQMDETAEEFFKSKKEKDDGLSL